MERVVTGDDTWVDEFTPQNILIKPLQKIKIELLFLKEPWRYCSGILKDCYCVNFWK
jgi:hypothetical protein